MQGEPNLARQALLDRLPKIDPNMETIITMRSVARTETFFLQTAFWVSLMLGGLALLLTVSGLFSMLSYLVEQRTREIGLRMALGASPRTVTQLVLGQTTRPVMAGLIAGAALAAEQRFPAFIPRLIPGFEPSLRRSAAWPGVLKKMNLA